MKRPRLPRLPVLDVQDVRLVAGLALLVAGLYVLAAERGVAVIAVLVGAYLAVNGVLGAK